MSERPILMSAPMVRAILAGTKTQTRRAVKRQPDPLLVAGAQFVDRFWCWLSGHDGSITSKVLGTGRCPYGVPGDRLWCRETWHTVDGEHAFYRADYIFDPKGDREHGIVWRPSIHMPRWASRITLEITDVRVERLQEISPEDAIAEGLKGLTKDGSLVKYGIPDQDGLPGRDDIGWPWHEWRISPIDAYQRLWESINGAGSWDRNPWVWVVCFKRVTP